MANKKLIFVSAYCQNSYQENRIKNFVDNQGFGIINTSFNINPKLIPTNEFNQTRTRVKRVRSIDGELNKISSKEMNLISKSDEVWVLVGSLSSNLSENKTKMYLIDNYSKELNKPLKYFYIYQSGSKVGETKSIDRKEIFNGQFYAFLHWRENK